MNRSVALSLVLTSAVALAACGGSGSGPSRDQIRAVGSSTVYPFVTLAAENFGQDGNFRTPIVEATGGTVRRIAAAGDAIAMPAIVGLNPAPSYGGADYIGIKRTGSSEPVGARSTTLASGFFGLAVLLGAVVAAWLAESGRRLRRRR